MNINSLFFFLFFVFIMIFSKNAVSFPLPIPPNTSIKDIIQHGKRALEKGKQDKNAQEEYKKKQEEFGKNINNKKEDQEIINQKNELRKKFNGNWFGEFVLKKENDLDASCKLEISINKFEGEVKSNCEDLTFKIYLFINLDRNLENSYILTSKHNEKIKLFGDITSFGGNNAGLYVRGSLEKL